MKVFSYAILLSATIVISVILLIAATPLKEYIPGFPDARYRQMLIRTALQVDSLENEIRIRDNFFQSIKALVEGDIPKDELRVNDSVEKVREIPMDRLNIDSIFQDKILEGQFSLTGSNERSYNSNDLSRIHFFAPLKGIISNRFDSTNDHFGVDLVSNPNARISSVLNGTVIFSDWSLETGYTIAIQHVNNLVSVYKHNSELLKAIGNKVKAGEAIAIIGNTGEMTTGPHLHFELWFNGVALDPLKYIDF
jgi:murein DD-endopeptidase MepM/ murein hydrolase activator NlpD